MKKTVRVTNGATISQITELLKKNLFSLSDNAWIYTDDLGTEVMSISFRYEENGAVLDIEMIDDTMQILIDKILDEING